MKYYLIPVFLMFGCGSDPTIQRIPSPIPSLPAPEPSIEPSAVPEEEDTFEGTYLMANGSVLDVIEDSKGLTNIQNSRVVVENKDKTQCLIPFTGVNNLAKFNKKLVYSFSPTYNNSHNTKKDADNTVLTGSFVTELIFFKRNDKLVLRIIISNTNSVVFDHELNEIEVE